MRYLGFGPEPGAGHYAGHYAVTIGSAFEQVRIRISDDDMRRLHAAQERETAMDDVTADLTLGDLLKQARKIWGDNFRQGLPDIVVRLMVGVGDLARLARDSAGTSWRVIEGEKQGRVERRAELAKELGNLIFSTIRWCDDLHLSPAECVRAAIEAQQKFAQSGKQR